MTIRKHEEGGVEVFEAKIDGEVITWDSGLTYARHLQTEQLLSCQLPVSDKPDEMLFIIMHQSMELWMKLQLHEAGQLIKHLREDQISRACKTLHRMDAVLRHMTNSWEVLATLTPHDFITFRGHLGRASGFQSHQFRELEFRFGLKRADMMLVHQGNRVAEAALGAALKEPSVYEELLMLLARRGYAIPEDVLVRKFDEEYVPNDAVEDVWLEIYSDPDAHRDEFRLAERFTALEYYFQEWRFKHMKTIARIIGHRPGTGGSSGVDYLVKSLGLTFFPELWSMRARMTADQSDAAYGVSQAPVQ
ncbi:MAG: tryptophan 2,3-dioxygenase family protein [Erythrobacter sp.]